ncbi:hypothetical protein FSG13_018400 [Escherichia coli]|nr:hypothetical protein [Escherichia coli]
MKLIIFILIVLIIAALLIRIILRSVNQHSPLLMQLHAAGNCKGLPHKVTTVHVIKRHPPALQGAMYLLNTCLYLL